jgi:hypothetical protein
MRPVNRFQCQGICWKFRFAGKLTIWHNGHVLASIPADRVACRYTLPVPCDMKVSDDVCVQVVDTEPRWFRWFRPNSAHVALEGLECEP